VYFYCHYQHLLGTTNITFLSNTEGEFSQHIKKKKKKKKKKKEEEERRRRRRRGGGEEEEEEERRRRRRRRQGQARIHGCLK
jgi:hypothetical protein